MSQAPGFERLTRSEPGEGTKGVTMDAAATGEPERSWIITSHPLRSLLSLFLSLRNEPHQPFLRLLSCGNEREREFLSELNLQLKIGCLIFP
eukprot:Gb_39793 [translate_table: standard]